MVKLVGVLCWGPVTGVIVAGYAFAKFFLGGEYQQNVIAPIQQSFETARRTLPLS